jgi:hypothetical protein
MSVSTIVDLFCKISPRRNVLFVCNNLNLKKAIEIWTDLLLIGILDEC